MAIFTVWSLYNIGSCCHVIVQVVFWVELPYKGDYTRFSLNHGSPEKGARWCGVWLLDIYKYSEG